MQGFCAMKLCSGQTVNLASARILTHNPKRGAVTDAAHVCRMLLGLACFESRILVGT